MVVFIAIVAFAWAAAAPAGAVVPPRPDGASVELATIRPFQGGSVDVAVVDDGGGVLVAYASGDVAASGSAVERGPRPTLAAGEAVVALVPSGSGYLLVSDAGRVFAFGDAVSHGDLAGVGLAAPIVDAVATVSGGGYWLLGGDGGVFAFGDAAFWGSTGDIRLNRPVNGMVPDRDGTGYLFAADDGGVFAFATGFRGSMGGTPLNAPVVGMVPYGDGYVLVASDGGTFVFADEPFHGSLGGQPSSTSDDPVVDAAAYPDGTGYVLLHGSGRLTSFGTHPAWITEGDDPHVAEDSLTGDVFSIVRFFPWYSIRANGYDGTPAFFGPGGPRVSGCRVRDFATFDLEAGPHDCDPSVNSTTFSSGGGHTAYFTYDVTAPDGAPAPSLVFRVTFGEAIGPPVRDGNGSRTPLALEWEYLGASVDDAATIRADAGWYPWP